MPANKFDSRATSILKKIRAENELSDICLELTEAHWPIWFWVMKSASEYPAHIIASLEELITQVARSEWGPATEVEFDRKATMIIIRSGDLAKTFSSDLKRKGELN